MLSCAVMNISVITLGVQDIEASSNFYQALDLIPEHSKSAVIYFQLGAVKLALYPKEKLVSYLGIKEQKGSAPLNFSNTALSCNLDSVEQVVDFIDKARVAGAVITVIPQEQSWGGFAGVFCDLDGYAWEIVYNPAFS